MSSNNDLIIGIDLGTSNSVACVYVDGKPTLIPSSGSPSIYGPSFPSYVAFDDERVLVGEEAKKRYLSNPKDAVSRIKREMGKNKKLELNGALYSPQEISAYILERIKKDAEKFLRQHYIKDIDVKNAIITVPAYFDDNQRTATKDAAKIAGLNADLINEPTAASLAYGIDNQGNGIQKILVFDLGGGTLDVTIMQYGAQIFEVKATSGDTNLGGGDMDNIIFDYIVKDFEKQYGTKLDISNRKIRNNIVEAAEKAKIDLSTSFETEINLPFIGVSADGIPVDLITKINRSQLENLVRRIVERCAGPIQQALDDAGLTKRDIDKLILVGGPTRMPIVRKFVENFLGLTAEEGIDPMACVAQGAAIKGGVESGEIDVIKFITDVVPLSLGIIISGNMTEVLVERNTSIPITKSKKFWTTKDNQKKINVKIVQGEYSNAEKNTYLGSFSLNVKPAPKHETIVEITFEIDEDATVNVTAKDENTGNKKSLKLVSPNKMTGIEVERAIKKVKENIEKDRKWRIWAESKNKAYDVIYDAENLIDRGNLNYSDKENINSLINKLKEVINNENPTQVILYTKRLKNKIEDL